MHLPALSLLHSDPHQPGFPKALFAFVHTTFKMFFHPGYCVKEKQNFRLVARSTLICLVTIFRISLIRNGDRLPSHELMVIQEYIDKV